MDSSRSAGDEEHGLASSSNVSISESDSHPTNSASSSHEQYGKPKKKKKFSLPWGFRIVAWVIVFLGTLTAAAFTTFYGVMFGDYTCKKWLTSMLVSFFSSVFLSQPVKVGSHTLCLLWFLIKRVWILDQHRKLKCSIWDLIRVIDLHLNISWDHLLVIVFW